jgi:hypothetical protein
MCGSGLRPASVPASSVSRLLGLTPCGDACSHVRSRGDYLGVRHPLYSYHSQCGGLQLRLQQHRFVRGIRTMYRRPLEYQAGRVRQNHERFCWRQVSHLPGIQHIWTHLLGETGKLEVSGTGLVWRNDTSSSISVDIEADPDASAALQGRSAHRRAATPPSPTSRHYPLKSHSYRAKSHPWTATWMLVAVQDRSPIATSIHVAPGIPEHQHDDTRPECQAAAMGTGARTKTKRTNPPMLYVDGHNVLQLM